MRQDEETPVLIVGAGPVGLTLAMDLAWRGVEVLVAERRYRGEAPPVKCNHTSARSMEIFRRLGLAAKIRNTGLPADFPNDVTYSTTMVGEELTRIRIPCRRDRYGSEGYADSGWPTPEPPHRINQIHLEPVMFEHAVAMPKLRILNRVEIEDYEHSADGAVAAARDLETGDTFKIRCAYLIGCDGGRSTVRRKMGVKYVGDEEITRVLSTHIRAPGLIDRVRDKLAWMYHPMTARQPGVVVAIDGKDQWLVHCSMGKGNLDFDKVDREAAIRAALGVEDSFQFEVLSKEDWIARRLVAERFRDRAVFLCGDAAHIWMPVAGYGMNAGIADATNLSWMLAGVLNGWASPDLLDAYEAERHPITEQVSRFAMNVGEKNLEKRRLAAVDLEVPGPEGDAIRARIGRELYELNVKQFCCAGLNFGYFYEGSPIVAYDDEAAPVYTMDSFTASTVPGCRTPHLWLRDGRSLYDALGPEFTLLRFDRNIGVDRLVNTAKSRGLALAVLDVDAADAAQLYRHKLVLSRPDQHVAWRGNAEPDDPVGLIDLVRGAQPIRLRKAS